MSEYGQLNIDYLKIKFHYLINFHKYLIVIKQPFFKENHTKYFTNLIIVNMVD
jgi:hypothetical protein